MRTGQRLAVEPQNFYEFWVVATRAPEHNGLGMTPDTADHWLGFFARRFAVLPDLPDLLPRWRELVRGGPIRGYRAHDARLAAAYLTHGVGDLLTFNDRDFRNLGLIPIVPGSEPAP